MTDNQSPSEFDFEPRKSRAFYNRPTTAAWSMPAIWIGVSLIAVCAIVGGLFLWHFHSGPKAEVEGQVWSPEQLAKFLHEHGVNQNAKLIVNAEMDAAVIGELLIKRFPDNASARVFVANAGPFGFAWGRFVIGGPLPLTNQAKAALGIKT